MGILRSLFARPAARGRTGRRPHTGRATFERRLHGDAALSLWELLRSREFRDWRFRRQHPLGPFVVDFVCVEQALVIELRSEPGAEADDKGRREFLERLGFRVVKFAPGDVLGDPRAVRRAIGRHLRLTEHS